MCEGLRNYDNWKTDPEFGRRRGHAEERPEEPSWQCEHGIHGSCRPKVAQKVYTTDEQGKGRLAYKYRYVEGSALTCGCDCHESDYCHSCGYYNCQCDAMYEARYGR